MQRALTAGSRPAGLSPISRRSGSATAVPLVAAPSPRLFSRDAPARLDVVAMAKGKGGKRAQQMMSQAPSPPVPPIDPDNEEFVLFIRAKKFPQWFPLSIVKGGTTANMLVKSLDNELGKKLAKETLVRNIGQVIYRDRKKIENEVKKMAALKAFSDFEYGFKIRDKTNAKTWFIADKTVMLIPPEEELGKAPIDQAKEAINEVSENVSNFFNKIGKIGS